MDGTRRSLRNKKRTFDSDFLYEETAEDSSASKKKKQRQTRNRRLFSSQKKNQKKIHLKILIGSMLPLQK